MKIGLSCIVKNESKVILNMLESASKFIDYWCIVDTGSTDGTQQIIKEYFEQKNIPGELIEIPWKNFSTSRNKALDGLKDKVDWGFWIDADETLTFKSDFNITQFKNKLTNDYTGGYIDVLHGPLIYKRMQLFNLKYPWKWLGPVHEVLVNDTKYHKSLNIDEFVVNYHTTGHSWTSQTQEQKYEKYIKLLTDYIEENPEQDNSRWIFYLAQSYRDTGSIKYYPDVIKWYQERLKLEGYWEEKYVSALYIARTKKQIGWNAGLGYSDADILESFMKCTQYNTERIEHFEPIIEYYQLQRDWENAYIFSSHAVNKKYKDFLFCEAQIYRWRIYDIHAMSCFYTKRYDEMKKYGEILKQILQTTNFIPMQQIDRVKSNLKFYLPS